MDGSTTASNRFTAPVKSTECMLTDVYCFKRRCSGFAACSPRAESSSSSILTQVDQNLVSLSDMLFLMILTPVGEVQ